MNKQPMAGMFSPPNSRIRLRLAGPSRPFDTRSTAVREDLADVAAAHQHLAPHYAAAIAHVCTAPSAMLHGRPDASASAVTQLLHGETFHMLDIRAGWAWGYCGHDHYVGYVRAEALVASQGVDPSHRVKAGGGLLFSGADIKAPVIAALPAGALVEGKAEGDFLATPQGWLHLRHVAPADAAEADWAEVARAFLGMPYLWGGRGGGGIDCSGLVQVALGLCGHATARDTDQQAESVGRLLAEDEGLQRGDIVFFPGHVGIMTDSETLVHANAYWMRVTEEPLADVVERLKPLHAQPVTARRRVEP